MLIPVGMLSFQNTQRLFVDKRGVAHGLRSLSRGPGTDGDAPRQVGADLKIGSKRFLRSNCNAMECREFVSFLGRVSHVSYGGRHGRTSGF